MSEPALVTGAFAAHLEANRDAINQAVLAAARQSAAFDPVAFASILRTSVAPVVDAVDRQGEGFVGVVADSLVDVALDLSAQGRFDGAVRDGWDRLLPALGRVLTLDPRRVIASVTNALDTLGRAPGVRPDHWVSRLLTVAAAAADVDDLLAAGQVAAWCSGMAAYRRQALARAASLDPPVAAAALGLGPDGDDVGSVLERLAADPWFDPTVPSTGGGQNLDPAHLEVGSFRGFGGTFLRPPTLVAVDDHVQVTDGSEVWSVFADAFGSAVIRAPGAGPVPPGSDADADRFAAPPPAALAGVTELTGWAQVPGGLVATSALSHAVVFVRVAS